MYAAYKKKEKMEYITTLAFGVAVICAYVYRFIHVLRSATAASSPLHGVTGG